MLRRPSFGLAEIAWRWSFGAAATLLLAFACFEYLDTLPVSRGDLIQLRTGQPALISRALGHIFHGSASRVIETGLVLGLALGIAWVVVATLARAATIKALVGYFHEGDFAVPSLDRKMISRLGPLLQLNLFRAFVTLAALAGCLAALMLGRAATSAADPSPGSAFLIFLTVAVMVWLAWSTLNWFLSLAGIFAVANGDDAFAAIGAAIDLFRTRAGSLGAAGTWFALARITAFVAAGSIIAFPLGLAAVLPAGVVLGGVLLVALLYFAIADFLYVGRLAAYVAILELPETISATESSDGIPPSALNIQPRALVDQNELILSDIPATS
jgi:hypothetical protein